MCYVLAKVKKTMKLSQVSKPIVDTYQSINLKPYYVDKYFKSSHSISQSDSPTVYKELESLIKEVNLFKEKVVVPNKVFEADRPGRSCLRRDLNKGVIYLGYRTSQKAKSPNTCFLTDNPNSPYSSWVCMDTFCRGVSKYTGGNIYYIDESHPDYWKWFKYMDLEYERLTGIKVERSVDRAVQPLSDKRTEALDSCLLGYGCIKPEYTVEFYLELLNSGLCKLNFNKTALYDKNGFWVGRFEEYPEGDSPELEMIKGVLSALTQVELRKVSEIISRFIEKDFEPRSLFEI